MTQCVNHGARPALGKNAILALALTAVPAHAANLSDTLNGLIPGTGLNLTLNSVTPFAVADGFNLAALRQEVYNNWVYPNGDVIDGSATVSAVTRLADAAGLDPNRVADHVSLLESGAQSLQPGDRLYTTSWTLTDPTHGTFNFSSLSYEDPSGEAKFDALMEQMPSLQDVLRGNRYIRQTRADPNDVNFRVRRHYGGAVAASGFGDLTIVCDSQGHIVSCNALPGDSQSFLWEAKTTNSPPRTYTLNGVECCETVFYFAFSNGFKSIKIGADGFTLEVTGSLGWGGRDSALVTKCCEIPAPGALGLVPALGIALTRRRRSVTHA